MRKVKHGHSKGNKEFPEYGAWKKMKGRCNNRKDKVYKYYGGRGITVCDEWHSFGNFLKDMGKRPSTLHSLDRKDNNGNYEPSNCRWATKVEQATNRRSNRFINFYGTNKTLSEWSKIINISWSALDSRLKNGCSIQKALTTPLIAKYSHKK